MSLCHLRFLITGSTQNTTLPSKDNDSDFGPGFERCLKLAMLFGGDADTIMSMTGAIAGAYFGESAIPDYVRAHHMFSRILNFLFVIVIIRKLSFCQLYWHFIIYFDS